MLVPLLQQLPPALIVAIALFLKYVEQAMSGIAIIVIVILALLVVAGGSIFVLGLSHRERHTQLDAHRADNGRNPRDGDQ